MEYPTLTIQDLILAARNCTRTCMVDRPEIVKLQHHVIGGCIDYTAADFCDKIGQDVRHMTLISDCIIDFLKQDRFSFESSYADKATLNEFQIELLLSVHHWGEKNHEKLWQLLCEHGIEKEGIHINFYPLLYPIKTFYFPDDDKKINLGDGFLHGRYRYVLDYYMMQRSMPPYPGHDWQTKMLEEMGLIYKFENDGLYYNASTGLDLFAASGMKKLPRMKFVIPERF